MGKNITQFEEQLLDTDGIAWIPIWDVDEGKMKKISKNNFMNLLANLSSSEISLFGENVNEVESGRIRFVEELGSVQGAYIHYDGSTNELKIGMNHTTDVANDIDVIEIDRPSGSIKIGNPTGGYKGYGSINARSFFDDDILLSCYVFDQKIDGSIDLEKWDGKVPNRVVIEKKEIENRKHDFARKFKGRINGKYDPLDIDKFTQHWKDKRHLTFFPNEEKFNPEKGMASGSWIQRIIEGLEIYPIHIDTLNQKNKELEVRVESQQKLIDDLLKRLDKAGI